MLDPADGVATIETVLPSSPGELAGLQAGDQIVSIDGRKPSYDPDDPAFLQPVGTVVHLTVHREGATKNSVIKLADVL